MKEPLPISDTIKSMPVSATLGINERSNAMILAGKKVYKLGLGQSPFPVAAPVIQALKDNARQKDYLPVRGLKELREAVAAYYGRAQGLGFTWDDIIIGPGSKELMFILQLVYDADLLLPSPSWVSYAPQAALTGRRVCWLNTERDNKWLLTPDTLEAECAKDPARPRVLLLNYPNNPTGYSYNADELHALAETARRYGVLILSDEIYGEVNHDGSHVSIAKFYPEGTIVSGGLSKWCGAGGWRLGTFAVPTGLRKIVDAMAVVASETFTSVSAPIQYAAVKAFTPDKEIDAYLFHSRKVLKALGAYCADTLRNAGAELVRPDGGFYLFPDFSPLKDKLSARGIHDSAEMCERLLEETGVATLAGSCFGRPADELTLRLSYVDFDGGAAIEESAELGAEAVLGEDFLRKRCGNTMEAIDAMSVWFGK
ncbi:aminotransferase class I/II-fold pyridoxal phosphate-dependent enzyme [Geovibrio thiophilus]|uniref:Aminotransferase n=1 Tax=Geovibrio thiophilus TaxID=139438 RepID=A0A410JYD4_9BACT|nr:aminotransferase class I/II-fold pyridoxal phosphate-dependent enzyme [Geovibrio thiophilus]QAR33143.1 aminotransferase class I/II-fold pyridoxal phosphate-dependent enzyme [Geovibrio thiophilus]